MIDFRFNYPVLPSQHPLLIDALSALEPDESYMKMAVPGGYPDDRQTGAEWLSKPAYKVENEAVLIGCGGHHALTVIILATGLSGGKVLVDPVTYNGFIGLASMFNITLVPCAMDEHGIIPQAMTELCADPSIKAVYLMPTIHNPLCYVMPLQRREAIVDVARRFDLILIDDDAYGFLEPDILPSFAHLAPERGFFIYSFAKILAPGVKTSYILTPEKWRAQVTNALWMTVSGSVTLYNRLMSNWINAGIVAQMIEEKRKVAAEKQKIVARVLSGRSYSTQPTSFHFWLPLPASVNPWEFGKTLAESGVDVVTSAGYNVAGDPGFNGIRVALGNVSEEKILIDGLTIIDDLLTRI